jgi:hypothetical protein
MDKNSKFTAVYVIRIYDRSGAFTGFPVTSPIKTDRHDIRITNTLLKVALNTTKQTNKPTDYNYYITELGFMAS